MVVRSGSGPGLELGLGWGWYRSLDDVGAQGVVSNGVQIFCEVIGNVQVGPDMRD